MHLKSLFSTLLPLPPSSLPLSMSLTPQLPLPPLPLSSLSAHHHPCQHCHHHCCSCMCFPGSQAINILTPTYLPPPLVTLILSLPFKPTDMDPLPAHTRFTVFHTASTAIPYYIQLYWHLSCTIDCLGHWFTVEVTTDSYHITAVDIWP